MVVDENGKEVKRILISFQCLTQGGSQFNSTYYSDTLCCLCVRKARKIISRTGGVHTHVLKKV